VTRQGWQSLRTKRAHRRYSDFWADFVCDDVYVNMVDPEAKIPEPNPLGPPKPMPTKKMPLPIQRLVFSVE